MSVKRQLEFHHKWAELQSNFVDEFSANAGQWGDEIAYDLFVRAVEDALEETEAMVERGEVIHFTCDFIACCLTQLDLLLRIGAFDDD